MDKTGLISAAFFDKAKKLIPKNKRDSAKTYQRKTGAGRPGIPKRKILSGMLYVLRKGIPWKQLPKNRFGCHTCIHRYFKQWLAAGFFSALFKNGLANWPEMEGIMWHWQPDASNGKVTDDGKNPYAHRTWCPVYKQRRPKKRKSAKMGNIQTPKQVVPVTQECEDAPNSLQKPSPQEASPQESVLKKKN